MSRGSGPARSHAELARPGFGVCNKLRNRAHLNRWVHDEDKGVAADACDGRGVTDEIEIQLVIERRVDGVWYAADEESVSICRRTQHRLGADIAPGTWSILGHERLAEPVRQPLSNHTCGGVGWAAGCIADDEAHRPRRIRLRPRDTRHRQQRGSTRCQLQKSTTGKFHFTPPSHHSITSSARASSVGGTLRPRTFAVVRLMTRSNLVGCSTGISAGFAPRRILST